MANDLYDKLTRKLLRARDQDANYKTAKTDLWADVQAEPERHLEMFFNNWFNHNWTREPSAAQAERVKRERTTKPYQPRPVETPAQARERRKEEANLRGLALMNMYLSDGETRLKDATGKEIRQYGGWLLLIAKHVKPAETVGRKLTAEQVANLWTQAQK